MSNLSKTVLTTPFSKTILPGETGANVYDISSPGHAMSGPAEFTFYYIYSQTTLKREAGILVVINEASYVTEECGLFVKLNATIDNIDFRQKYLRRIGKVVLPGIANTSNLPEQKVYYPSASEKQDSFSLDAPVYYATLEAQRFSAQAEKLICMNRGTAPTINKVVNPSQFSAI